MEKSVKEFDDKLTADLKSDISTKIAAVQAAVKGEDAVVIRSAVEALNQTAQRIGQAAYSGEAATAAAPDVQAGYGNSNGGYGGNSYGGQANDGTIEGQYREV